MLNLVAEVSSRLTQHGGAYYPHWIGFLFNVLYEPMTNCLLPAVALRGEEYHQQTIIDHVNTLVITPYHRMNVYPHE